MRNNLLKVVLGALLFAGFLSGGCAKDDKTSTDAVSDVSNSSDVAKDETATGDVADANLGTDIPVGTDLSTSDVPLADVPAVADAVEETAQADLEDVGPAPLVGSIKVKVAEVETTVDLSTLEQTTFQGVPAVRLTRVVEVAAIALPYNYHYNFIAADGFNVLVDKMDGDYSKLPWWLELEQGFVYFDAEKAMLRVGWDEALGMPGSLGVKGMDGGTIEAVEVGATQFVLIAGTVRFLVETATLPTVDVVDYKHPEDGAKPMIALAEVFTAAGLVAPEGYEYKFYGKDGFSNNDSNLMPYENTTHGYYEPVKRRIILEELWDTNECCWSVKDTVLIIGTPI